LILWCLTHETAREWGKPYGPGLRDLGLDPARFLLVEARTATDAAWALEEALKSRSLSAVLGQVEEIAPLAARRLGLAAKEAHRPCLLLSSHAVSALPGTQTRWRVAAHPSEGASFDREAPGPPSFRLTLERCRGHPPQSWTIEFSDDAYDFRLSAASADRAAETRRQAHSG
jgi:protein ImuA